MFVRGATYLQRGDGEIAQFDGVLDARISIVDRWSTRSTKIRSSGRIMMCGRGQRRHDLVGRR